MPEHDPVVLVRRCTFPAPGTKVTCAVSGGADSLALLALAAEAGCDATAIHVDHGTRPSSATEADVVRDAASRFGASFESRRVEVAAGANLEARMRAARYAVLPDDVLTGHTADDQAETVLLNLLRGSGATGLGGISPQRRPLLGLRRAETHALCAALGLTPVVDPTNADATHRRNRIRHEALPLLDDIAQRDVAVLLCRTADLARADDELLEQLAIAVDPTDARLLAAAAWPLATRAVRRWLTPHLGGRPPQLADVERVLAVARGDGTACEVAGALRVSRSKQRLDVQPVTPPRR